MGQKTRRFELALSDRRNTTFSAQERFRSSLVAFIAAHNGPFWAIDGRNWDLVMTLPQLPVRASMRRLQRPYAKAAVAAGALLAASALLNYYVAKRAENANPPEGKFIDVDGVSLHYIERGKGDPLVLLHGNGSMIQDFVTSGLIDMAAKSYRVFAFDRPGYGHSDRPRSTIWTAEAQAKLIHRALKQLGVDRAIILGHSWGTSVALALVVSHAEVVRGLVLASGYYYPSVRADVIATSGPAIPIFGDVLRYTISPLLGRLMWPLILRKIFGPSHTPTKFNGFPVAIALRPSALRASAAEAALMIPDAIAGWKSYEQITAPVAIISGEEDRIVDIESQSGRLHRALAQSTFDRVPGAGHMIH
jgi:pimeloyl-ACP methyl ester carboxylesterase